MDYFLAPLLSALLLYGYVALFAIEYVAAIIVPFPISATLLAVGAFSSQGYFNFWIAFAVAVAGNTAGDVTGYWLTRRYGDTIIRSLKLRRLPFFETLTDELRTDAAITVSMTRFAGALSPIVNFLAGLVGVPLATFIIFDMLGNLVEPTGGLTLGYLAGTYWSNFSATFDIAGAVIAVVVIMFVLYRMHRRIMNRYARSGGRKSVQ